MQKDQTARQNSRNYSTATAWCTERVYGQSDPMRRMTWKQQGTRCSRSGARRMVHRRRGEAWSAAEVAESDTWRTVNGATWDDVARDPGCRWWRMWNTHRWRRLRVEERWRVFITRCDCWAAREASGTRGMHSPNLFWLPFLRFSSV